VCTLRDWFDQLAYLTECRMDEAEELLADRSLTVAQVAEGRRLCGPFRFQCGVQAASRCPPH
jgi:AraC-like DNA-binding protein